MDWTPPQAICLKMSSSNLGSPKKEVTMLIRRSCEILSLPSMHTACTWYLFQGSRVFVEDLLQGQKCDNHVGDLEHVLCSHILGLF